MSRLGADGRSAGLAIRSMCHDQNDPVEQARPVLPQCSQAYSASGACPGGASTRSSSFTIARLATSVFPDPVGVQRAKVRDRVADMVLVHGGDTKGVDRLASSWAERRQVPQVTFSLDMRLGARAGFKRNERMLSLDPRYVIAFPGNGVLERLVIEAKTRRITVVDRRGPLGTSPKAVPPSSE